MPRQTQKTLARNATLIRRTVVIAHREAAHREAVVIGRADVKKDDDTLPLSRPIRAVS